MITSQSPQSPQSRTPGKPPPDASRSSALGTGAVAALRAGIDPNLIRSTRLEESILDQLGSKPEPRAANPAPQTGNLSQAPANSTPIYPSSVQKQSNADQLAELIAKYVYDPVKFVSEVLKVKKIDPKQCDIMNGIVEKHFVAVRSGNGVGKTAVEAWVSIWFLITRYMSKVPCIAVNQKQMNSNLWPEIAMWISKSPLLSALLDCRNEFVRVKGYRGWEIMSRAAVNSKGQINTGLQGIHANYICYVMDECSGIPDQAIDSVESSGTSDNSYGLACANPTRRNGFFFHLFHKNRGSWLNIHIKPGESSQVGEKFYSRMERKYGGKNTNGYKIRVLGDFPSAEDTGLLDWEAYQKSLVEGITRDVFDEELGVVRMAIDPAGSGPEADASTFSIRKGRLLFKMESFHGLTNPGLLGKTRDLIEEYGVKEIVVDKIGLGRGLHEDLESIYEKEIEAGELRVYGVNVGTSAYDNAEFFNLRAELYYTACKALATRQVVLCEDWPFLEMDLTDIQKKYTMTRKLQIERKEEFRDRNDGRSTDYGDAFVLQFYDEHIEEEYLGPTPAESLSALVSNRELMREGSSVRGEMSGMYSGRVRRDSGFWN